MIKLKPFVRLGFAPDVIFAMTENRVESLTADYKPLLDALRADSFDPQLLSDDDIGRLKQLELLKLVYNESDAHVGLASAHELNGWRESFVLNQLDHLKVAVVNHHSDPTWSVDLTAALKGYGFTIVQDAPTISVLVLERLNQLTDSPQPALPVKVGSYVGSVGPLLCPTLPAADLKAVIDPGKAYFEHESFQVADMPATMRSLQLSLLATEVAYTLVQLGSYDTLKNIVEWNVTTLRRQVWPI